MLPPLTLRGHASFRGCPFRSAYGFFSRLPHTYYVLARFTDLPPGITTCPSPGLYGPSTTELECGVDLWLCPAGSCAPPLIRQNGVRRWAMGGLLTGLVYFVFLSRLGLMFPCLASCLFTVGCGFFLTGCTSAEVFRFVVFRLGVSSVVFTHSTGVYFYHHVKVVYGHGQGQRVLAGGASGWTVVGGLVSS